MNAVFFTDMTEMLE